MGNNPGSTHCHLSRKKGKQGNSKPNRPDANRPDAIVCKYMKKTSSLQIVRRLN